MDWTWKCERTQLYRAIIPLLAIMLGACTGSQSILAPAGLQAERIATLFWWMFGGGMLIWMFVVALALYVIKVNPGKHDSNRSQWMIVGGGILFPAVVLSILLIYGLSLMPDTRRHDQAEVNISVSAEQWWWRIEYTTPDGETVELANEIRLPVGKSVLFKLTSTNVIHSFWIPALGGKLDMIPGRTNQLLLEPTRTGTFQGVCAEYCGTSHSFMRFKVKIMEPQTFDEWLATQALPAKTPTSEAARRGQQLFMANNCVDCHSIRGTEAKGRIGPDLTHVGSRLGLAADTLSMRPESFSRWIGHTREIKPGTKMPPFAALGEENLKALAAYLSGLE